MLSPDFIDRQRWRLIDKQQEYTEMGRQGTPTFSEHDFVKVTVSLRYIERALAKIEEGTYGICDSCGDEIPVKRLEAVPGATRCLTCQTTQEREYAEARSR